MRLYVCRDRGRERVFLLAVAVLSNDSGVKLKSLHIDLLVDVFRGEADDKFQWTSCGMIS